MAPAVLQAFGPGDDFAALDLSVAAFDLSDRGVEGQPQPGPLDAYVWLDRGIYRPGETVQVMALLREQCRPAGRPPRPGDGEAAERSGVPAGHPAARSRCRRPPAGGAVRRGRGRHLDGGGAGRPQCAADREGRVPRRCVRSRPDGGRGRDGPRGDHPRPARHRAGIRPVPVWRARPPTFPEQRRCAWWSTRRRSPPWRAIASGWPARPTRPRPATWSCPIPTRRARRSSPSCWRARPTPPSR